MNTVNPEILSSFEAFCRECGIRQSPLLGALAAQISGRALYTPLSCVAMSTPPQEGKTTWVAHWIAWQIIRNPRLNVIYASYSQFRANSVSKLIRALVDRFTPLPLGAKTVSQWRTRAGGGLLAAGRGTGVTGFSCDLLVIDDPIKDMKEAQSQTIREATVEWFSSVLMTRMAQLSQIVVICTRWHKDDLIAHVIKSLGARYVNIPAQATHSDDILGRKIGGWLPSVQDRTETSWQMVKNAVGTYVWQALYQGDPQVTGGALINVDKIDVIPWEQVVFEDQRGFMQTLDRALVVQSWDLTFGTVTGGAKRPTSGDFVAGHVYAVLGGTKWVLVDRVHARLSFTETVTEVLKMSARWPQTSRIYVEKTANGAALIDTLRKRAALIQPVSPNGSKEVRALATQPTVDGGHVAVLDTVYNDGMFQEFRDFPFGAHDDDVDAFTQAINNAKQDYFRMGN